LQDVDRPQNPATSETTALLVSAVRAAGALALTTFRGQVKQWLKEKSSPVCEADIAVDALLRDRLSGTGHAWLSEETEDDPARLDARSVWIVDPIDGTRSYLAGQDDWAVSVALACDGRPVLAALYAPVTDEFFLATAGGGATRNGSAIASTTGASLRGARFAAPKRRLERLSMLAGTEGVPRIGSLALRLARVATGEIDGTATGSDSHDWDLAAADLLVHEAGGALTTLAGETVAYNRPQPVHGPLVAAGRLRHATLIALIRDRGFEFA
jgi:myo-inositol-1(or 4)-monophosphatase